MSTDNTITMKEVLAYMATGKPFSCTVVAYDRKRRTGGARLELHEAVQLVSGRQPAARTRARTRTEQAQYRLGRNPTHGRWFTRNVQILQDGQPTAIVRKIHPPLIIRFNGKEMLI